MKSPLPAASMFAALSAISAQAENLIRNDGFESGENEFGPRWPTPNKQKS
jgi:hypothetical protein